MENLIAITWWLRLLILAAGSLFIASLLLKIRGLGVHPFREITRLVRRPWFELVILLSFVGGLVQYGATKGTGGNGQRQLMMQMWSPAPACIPIAVDSIGFSLPTNFPSITNLCFWGIEPGAETVALGIAWPDTMSFTNDCIDIFGSHQLASNGWWRLAQLDVSQIGSNAIVEFAYADFPTNTMRETAFYRLAAQDDLDGDGLTDKVEEWVLGTNPLLPDTDNDGLPDGDETGLDTNPKLTDSDGDGVRDGDECGYIVKASCFEWYDTTGWQTTYGEPPPEGIQSYFGAVAMALLPSGTVMAGVELKGAVCFENGGVYLYSPEYRGGWIFPAGGLPLNRSHYGMGDMMVAPYSCGSYVPYGDSTSYLRTGITSNNCFVVEYHNVKLSWYSDERMTYQVIIPGGTGNVIRVSYYSSDIWIDGANAVVGVQNTRITTPDGCYNLTWDFSERGPILPRTTIEYHLGYGTNPLCDDSDGDGLSDEFEINAFHSNPLLSDEDGDGLLDAVEYSQGTNPKSADSDGDGLPDKWEVDYGLCPTNSAASDGRTGDFDNDGLTNWQEYQEGCDPGNRDTDGDGVDDGEERTAGTSPLLPDSDYDGLSDSQELVIGTSPTQPDTDGDGMNDGWEWSTTFNPLVHNSNDSDPNNDYSADPDGDGLTNGQESDMGSNPNVADTDGDGVNDGDEITQSSDPNDAADLGVANSRVVLPFYYGDHSGSHSEKYCLRLTPIVGSGIGTTPRTLSYVNANYGECETKTVVLVPGWKYEITLGHAGTNLTEGPDYDYTLICTPPERVILSDVDGVFGVDDTSTRFAANGKVAHMYVLDFKFVTPAGDPVSLPVSASVRGQNEFTYDDVTSSLALTPHVQVLPTLDDELAAALNGQFTLPSITGAQLIWENGGGGTGTAENQEGFGDPPVTTTEFAAHATYQSYPTHNSGFGRKTVAFTCRGVTITQDFELFFPKFGTHHPVCTTCPGCPNWFYYWNMVCGDSNGKFDAGLTVYGCFRPQQTASVFVGDLACRQNGLTSHRGIDCFAETIAHEITHRRHYAETHIQNISDLDGDWLKDADETLGDLNLNGVCDTEDENGNSVLDDGEDCGLTRKELTLQEFNNGNPDARSVVYGAANGRIDTEATSIAGTTSRYHANTNGGDYDDEDDTCYEAEKGWVGGSVNTQDWSNPGKQAKSVY